MGMDNWMDEWLSFIDAFLFSSVWLLRKLRKWKNFMMCVILFLILGTVSSVILLIYSDCKWNQMEAYVNDIIMIVLTVLYFFSEVYSLFNWVYVQIHLCSD